MAQATDAVLPVDEFELPGKVEAVPTRFARLALPAPGRVRHVRVTLGDRVRAGQVLLTIDTPDVSVLQSAWRQAHADIKQREAALAKAEADASRVRDLLANRAIAQKEVLAAEADAGRRDRGAGAGAGHARRCDAPPAIVRCDAGKPEKRWPACGAD